MRRPESKIRGMPGYIFLPVPSQEMLGIAQDWVEGQKAKGKPGYGILRNYYQEGWKKGALRDIEYGALRNVAANDKLYVMLHGGAMGSKSVGAARGGMNVSPNAAPKWEGGVMKEYTPEGLAKVIEREGLITSFVDLRMYACGSGLMPEGEAKSFAERLQNALYDRDYKLVRVTGYLGSVKTSYVERLEKGSVDKRTPASHKGIATKDGYFRPKDFKVVFPPNAEKSDSESDDS